MSKKVLIISQNYYPEIGSAANRIKNMYVELTARGHQVTVLTSEPSYPNRNLYKDERFWQDSQLEKDVIRIRTRTRRYSSNIMKRLLLYGEMTYKFLRTIYRMSDHYDYIIATTPAIFIGLTGLIAKRRLGCPLILDVRDLWPESLLGVGVFTYKPIIAMARMLENKLYVEAENIIINSEGFMPHIKSKGIPSDRIRFMPNSLTEKELLPPVKAERQPGDPIVVIYTGNIGLAQDLEPLIRIAERLKDREDIRFKIIGYGYRRKGLKQRIQELGLTNVTLLKADNRMEATNAVRDADIAFVSLVKQPVFDTVLPGKMIDYMCMGKPIVGSVSGYAATVLERSESGFASINRDTDELYEYIVKLASDSRLRADMGNNGYHFARNNYRWKENIAVLAEILEKEYGKENRHVRLEPLYK
ncbi:glycosyltransferase family 4 protein [Paenibacillus kobensis]|uniref:glycosyltransferase family 4 protein n=1 Tax=Paenibacillus kobensis TaxID=59841 RepID=UPI000FD74EF1|nr:glycosyltransferase family 4 protein [Paenibacillus kobensis]